MSEDKGLVMAESELSIAVRNDFQSPFLCMIIGADGRMKDVNRAVLDELGYSEDDVLGKRIMEFIHPDQRGKVAAVLEKKFAGDSTPEMLVDVYAKDGSCHTVLMAPRFERSPEGNPPTDILITGIDITERKRGEEGLLQLINELERSNKELKDFSYTVSHDLKAPLHSINMLTQWISTDYADKLDEEGKERLNLLMSRVARMHALIDGILRYSCVEHVKEEKEEVNLNAVVSEAIALIDLSGDIEIEVADELPTIYCDKTQMEQVFQNLLGNAVRYMDKPKGTVTIGCTDEDTYWKFSVADNGPGIDERYHERIFRIFQTLHRRDEIESTGVGLTIVKKIVETQGGKIWVESKVGEGSTFFFTVPKQIPEGA